MNQYLLSTYRVEGDVPGAPAGPDEMKTFLERVMALEEEMVSEGAFRFGGALSGPDRASVVSETNLLATDGPFPEAKEQIAGFYIIDAPDDESAREWAKKVAEATRHPIEMRPFSATGLVKDSMRGG